MPKRSVPAPVEPAPLPGPEPPRRRWLLLAHQLPATPSNLRVKTWRRLQDLGAVAVKQAVYVLPDTPESREDFEWLRVEIEGNGGEAVVFAASHLSTAAEATLVEEFKQSRQALYAELGKELEGQQSKKGGSSTTSPTRDVLRLQQRFQAIERIDFFGSAGRDRVASLLAALKSRPPAASDSGSESRSRYQKRLWITRPRPGVDRMASAWLIRRFIDTAATFAFVTDVKHAPADALPFDMYGVGFGHEGDRCTFETLLSHFAIVDPAANRLAEAVHDLDLKDGKFGAPDALTLGAAIDGLQMACPDDRQLLEQGMTLFEAMYRSFSQRRSTRSSGTAGGASAARHKKKR